MSQKRKGRGLGLGRHPEKRGKKRPCLKCGRKFQPTSERWRLCKMCFTLNTKDDYGAIPEAESAL